MPAEPPPTQNDVTPQEPGLADSDGGHAGTFAVWISEGATPESRWRFQGDQFSIGQHPSNELVLKDSAVSRFHCEISAVGDEVVVRDLSSRNGTFVDGVRVKEAYLGAGSQVRVGRVALRIGTKPAPQVVLSQQATFGGLVGESRAMRAAFAVLERAAQTQATVLLEGETGTGKGAAALALHQAGRRRDRPFVVVDCGSIPENLVESELFGHERGAFTGADAPRAGAFEAAQGGTIFLDEVGELPLEVQPKLLRALEERQVRRLGNPQLRQVDVRVVAATNRDLRAAVNDGSFRADLYYRLAVVRLRMPALRDRLEDLPLIVARLVEGLGSAPEQRAKLTSPELLAVLRRSPWRGNIRELRNYLERSLVMEDQLPPEDAAPGGGKQSPFQEARKQAIAAFEREYLETLMKSHGGRVADAAEAAGLSRVYLYRLLARYQLLR